MEWNVKQPYHWDWENLSLFNPEATENYNHSEPTEWNFQRDEGFSFGSLNLAEDGRSYGSPVSDVVTSSSSKSSKPASINSSLIGESKTSKFTLDCFEALPEDYSHKRELIKGNSAGTSPTIETSAGSSEQLLSLKLGKQTYFEDICDGNSAETSFSVIPLSPEARAKRCKSVCPSSLAPRCQVEGCNLDLSTAKDYHRKHRVCDSHSKSPKVIIAGVERRFCQQCSRFHGLSEFDEKKRSCRKRLSDHNARRRKLQPKADSLNPARLSLVYDERQQMSFSSDRVPLVYRRPATYLTWESTCSSKYTQTKEHGLKPKKAGVNNEHLHPLGFEMSSNITMPSHDSTKPLLSKGTAAEVLSPGLEEYIVTPNINSQQHLHGALSLLSTNSWGICDSKHVNHPNQACTSGPTATERATNQVFPDHWRNEPKSFTSQGHVPNLLYDRSSDSQDFQPFRLPHEIGFFSNRLS